MQCMTWLIAFATSSFVSQCDTKMSNALHVVRSMSTLCVTRLLTQKIFMSASLDTKIFCRVDCHNTQIFLLQSYKVCCDMSQHCCNMTQSLSHVCNNLTQCVSHCVKCFTQCCNITKHFATMCDMSVTCQTCVQTCDMTRCACQKMCGNLVPTFGKFWVSHCDTQNSQNIKILAKTAKFWPKLPKKCPKLPKNGGIY